MEDNIAVIFKNEAGQLITLVVIIKGFGAKTNWLALNRQS
jgi:hypothetical protein